MDSSLIDQFDRISEEFVSRLRKGERPSVNEYVDRYPRLAPDIARLFPALAVMEEVGSKVSSLSASVNTTQTRWPAVPNEHLLLPERVGGYRILREIGSGGMGVVYEALQEALGRHVALKVLPFRGGGRKKYLDRFLREAQSAARLSHPHIVPVFDVGESDGMHYYAMQFIHGRGLDEIIRNENGGASQVQVHGGAEGLQRVVEIGIQVAEALDYAHREGVIHRDIKPSNLLLDERGHVWVTDFGLAKSEDSDELTEQGDIVGTLCYMPPERFNGWSDARSDVYSLGVTMYEMLTGRPPFIEKKRTRLIKQISSDEPPRLRKLNRRIPADLETIVLKAIAKEPGHRYATARTLADDLRCLNEGRPISARRVTWAGQLRRWAYRNPWVAGLSAALLLILIALPIIATTAALRFREQRNLVRSNLTRAETAEAAVIADRNEIARLLEREQEIEKDTEKRLRVALLAQSRGERRLGKIGRRQSGLNAMAQAAKHHPDRPLTATQKLELRSEAIACLALTDLRLDSTWSRDLPPANGVGITCDPNFTHYALTDNTGLVTIHNFADHRELARLTGMRFVLWLKFSPDGRYLLVRDGWFPGQPPSYNNVHVWDWREKKRLLSFMAPSEAGQPFDFRPDSQQVALGLSDQSVRVFDLPSGNQASRFDLPSKLGLLLWHPTENALTVSAGSPLVELREPCTGRLLALRFKSPTTVDSMTWSTDGKLLFTGCANGRGYVWDGATGRQRAELAHETRGIIGEFVGDQNLVLTGAWDGKRLLWDIRTRQLIGQYRATGRMQVSADGRRFINQSDGMVRLYHLAGGREWRTLYPKDWNLALPKTPSQVAFSSDNRTLALSTLVKGILLWDAPSGQETALLPDAVLNAFFAPEDECIYSSGHNGMTRWPIHRDETTAIWRIGPPQRLTPTVPGLDQRLCLSADGRMAALTAQRRGTIQVFQMGPKPRLQFSAHMTAAGSPLLSPDGSWLAVASWPNPKVRIWDTKTMQPIRDLPVDSWASWALSTDGKWLALSTDTETRQWHAGTWAPGPNLPDHLTRNRCLLAYSPDGRVIACATTDKRIHLLDARTLTELAVLESPSQATLNHLAMSPDSALLAAACNDHTIELWDLRLIRSRLAEIGLDWDAPPYPPAASVSPPPRIEVVAEAQAASPELPMPTADNATFVIYGATQRLLRNPLDAEALYYRGGALLELHRPKGAFQDLNSAIALNPNLFDAYHQRGHVFDRLDRRVEAVADFTKALTDAGIAPVDRAHVVFFRGLDHEILQHHEAARADFAEAQRLWPDRALYLQFAAWSHAFGPPMGRKLDDALIVAEAAARMAPDDPMSHLTLGLLLCRLGRLDDAKSKLQRALELSDNRIDSFALYLLAICHSRTLEPGKARECFDRAERWKPSASPHRCMTLQADLASVRNEAKSLLGKN